MKKTYNKGQKLYNNKPDSKAFGLWGEVTKEPNGQDGCYIKWSNGKQFYYSSIEIKEFFLTPEESKQISEATKGVTKWNFNVLSSAAIDEQEIKKNLTRLHPVGIVQISTGIVLVMIHQCLLEKAGILGMTTPETGFDGIYVLQTTQVSEWISWAKAVKKESWGDERVPAKVTVSLPTI